MASRVSSVSSSWTATAMVEKVEAGALCKGIYLTDDLEELLTEREAVVKVRGDLDFKGAKSIQETFQRVFNSAHEVEVFESNVDKCSTNVHASDGAEIWGLSLDKNVRGPDSKRDEGFVAAVTYELVPIATVNLTTNDLELRPEVITALQEIENTIKPLYKPKGHFQQFFQKFGSHFSHGLIEFGGILLSKASCQKFSISKVGEKKNKAVEASKIYLRDIFVAEQYKRGSDLVVQTKRVGGSPDTRSKFIWKESLKKSSHCRIIKRNSPPKPIWELIQKHKDKFKKPLVLANAMQEEWKNLKSCATRIRYKRLDKLRADVKMWLEFCKDKDEKNAVYYLKDLSVLRQDLRVSNEDWLEEVLYLSEVQGILEWSTQHMTTTTDPLQKQQLLSRLNKILYPSENIQDQHFPRVKKIQLSIRDADKVHIPVPFDLATIADLPSTLQTYVDEAWSLEESVLRSLQERFECTIKHWSKNNEVKYEYLLCTSLLRLRGFSTKLFRYEYSLSEEDFQEIIESLETHLTIFKGIDIESKKQAYLLYLATECKHDNHIALQEMILALPGGLCPEIINFQRDAMRGDSKLDLTKFKKDLGLFLEGRVVNVDVKTLLDSLKSQLSFMERPQKIKEAPRVVKQNVEKSVKMFLEALGLEKFYPQKLTYDEVITLTAEMLSSSTKKPTSLLELPWFFLRQIIAVDSSTRENSCVVNSPHGEDDSSDSDDSISLDDFEDSDDHENDGPATPYQNNPGTVDDHITSVNILDLIYVIFLCADDFLRQELVDKMAKCQYAVPFILPAAHDSQNLVLHWGLKSLSRRFCDNRKEVHETLVDVKAPVISCLSFGEETSWKSRMLNTMLCPQQETFWHQVLAGGQSRQKVSQGMVEAAWYLPGNHEDDLFSSPVTFLNCRGNALNSPDATDMLLNFSTVSCIFVDKVTKDLATFLRSKNTLEDIIVVVLNKKEDETSIKARCKKLRKAVGLEKYQIVQNSADDENFDTVSKGLKKSLDEVLQRKISRESLTALVDKIQGKYRIRIDDEQSHLGYRAAQKILKSIDEINQRKSGGAKREILPCHSDLNVRQEIAALEKELCRQRKRTENVRLENYARDIKESKLRLQMYQLQMPISETFRYFLLCMARLNGTERKYFLQTLGLGLNQRSVNMLEPLYEQYEKTRLKDESSEKEVQLKFIDEQITHGSLGLEHFFREMAVMYENIAAVKEKSQSGLLNDILESTADIMAGLLMEGTAMEIMDGDTVHVPVSWLKAVLNKVENSSRARLFKLSVLGAQSCGKSTLLNAAFGLNFPVGSGRCTRGAYMQLVKVEEKLRRALQCDFILVIDSEGLMSRLGSSSSDRDNELTTFIIGLSDLTLVINKGEGNEMQDVLPLAIHVFLRMNILGEHQACHFVHQNMGAVGDMQKTATEIDAFVRGLNEKTLAAAIDVDQSDNYTKFTDVLQYDEKKDNTYVPGLWDGSLPMAKTKTHYSHTVQKLKSDIVQHIQQFKEKKNFGTLCDFTIRVQELWEAIKYENFLFSFQNVLAVDAYTKLTKVYDELQFQVKRDVRQMIQSEQHVIENDFRHLNSRNILTNLIDDSKVNITNHILVAVGEAKRKILHYFHCLGCDNCSKDVKHRHFLAKYEKEFEDELGSLQKGLIKELENQMETLEVQLKADSRIQQLSTDMDDILKYKVHVAIQQRKVTSGDKEALEDEFSKIWREATGDIRRRAMFAEESVDIKAAAQDAITKLLGKDSQFYKRKIEENAKKRKGKNFERNEGNFSVDGLKHLKLKGRIRKGLNYVGFFSTRQDVKRLQRHSEWIIDLTKKYYDGKASLSGKRFSYKDGETLFKDVFRRVDDINDNRFKITRDYKIDLIHYIEKLAIPGFSEMHDRYCKESSPEALLEKKKKSYYDRFLVQMGQADATAKFCENVLKDLILQNIEDRLSCTELLLYLRVFCGGIFRDIKSLQASIMIDLYRENSAKKYINYICNNELVVKCKIQEEVMRHFEKGKHFKYLAFDQLDKIISILQDAVDKTCCDRRNETNLIQSFFSNMSNLKISHTESAAFLDLAVSDTSQFGAIVYRKLQGQIKKDILETVTAWSVSQKLHEKNLVEFIYNEIVGCNATCPFCCVPCDAHSGGKRGGNHSSTLHRPRGLGGVRFVESGHLVVQDCPSGVASPLAAFRHGPENNFSTPYRLYKMVYPDWTIPGDANPDSEKYWKWVFAQHNADFATYFSSRKGIIPSSWSRYSRYEIKKDIEDHYHVKVEL